MKNQNLTRLVIGLALLVLLLALTMATQAVSESYQNVVTEIVVWLNGIPVFNGDMDIPSLSENLTIKVISGEATGGWITNGDATKNWRWTVYQPKPFFMNYKNKVYEYQFMGYTFSGGNDADFKMVLLTSSPRWESNNYKRNRGKIYKGYQ